MNGRKASILAWSLLGLIVVSISLQMATKLARPLIPYTTLALAAVVAVSLHIVSLGLVAALIISRQPRNIIGWLLMVPAIAESIPAETYVSGLGTAPAHPPALLLLALWFSNWDWLLLIFPILFIAQLFPTGHPPSPRWRWLTVTALVLGFSFVLFVTFGAKLSYKSPGTGEGLVVANPIGFIPAGRFPLVPWYIGLGIVTIGSAASLMVRYRRAASDERAQIRWLLYASALFGILYLAVFWIDGQNTVLVQIRDLVIPMSLIPIPLAIGIAILRYRLWGIDVIIRRTLVYVPLTAILAGIMAASIKASQTVLAALVGGDPTAATVISTLVAVAAFDPVKGRLQKLVDAWLKEGSTLEARWKTYGEQLRTFLEMHDEAASAKKLLDEAVVVFEVKGGAVYLQEAGLMKQIHAVGEWSNSPGVTIPIEDQGVRLGELTLGARRNGRPFDGREHDLLTQNAKALAADILLLRSKCA